METGVGIMRTLAAGLAGGLLGGLVVVAAMTVRDPGRGSSPGPIDPAVAVNAPGLAYLDSFRCPRGLTRQVEVRGREDRFGLTDNEPSRIEPRLLSLGYYRDLAERRPAVTELREYDEGGTDRMLIDHVTIPGGTVMGELVLRVRSSGGGAENDYIGISPMTESGLADPDSRTFYGIQLLDPSLEPIGAPDDGLRKVKLESIPSSIGARWPTLLSELGAAQSDLVVNITVLDDTAVDFVALALCVEPSEVRGVTFSEHAAKPMGPDISVLSCSLDDTQRMCGPYQGDTPCSQSLPLACYRDGNAAKPPNMEANDMDEAKFVPGEVRLTEPVRGDTLETREEAEKLCADRFGPGFRMLRYQEGGGGIVISRSQIQAGARAWIEIRDQPRATCWSRAARGELR